MAVTLVQIISIFFQLFSLLILARILISWFRPDPNNAIFQFIYSATEPVLAPVRRLLPSTGMFDLSPMVVLIGMIVLERLLISLVISMF